MKTLADPRRDDNARTRAAQAFITHALAEGPRRAAEVERQAALLGISRRTLRRVRALCDVRATRVSVPGGQHGAGEWHWSLPARDTLKQDETPDER